MKTFNLMTLTPNPSNPRLIRNDEYKRLLESIKRDPDFLAKRPIVHADGVILGGNMRYRALLEATQDKGYRGVIGTKKAGEVPEGWVLDASEFDDEQRRRFVLVDNAPAGMSGDWDMDVLANEWGDIDLCDLGMDVPEWEDKNPTDPNDAEPQIDRAEELNKTWQVKTGDLWQIGEHRLLCGDSTKADDVARLMGGKKAGAIVADPPYGMRLDADFSKMVNNLKMAKEKGLKSGRKYKNVIGDDDDFNARPVISALGDPTEQFWFGAEYYADTLPDTQHSGAWLVWDKRLDESADKMFGSCFELCWSKRKCKRDIIRIKWAGVFGTEKEPQRGRQHPNQKPVSLLVQIVNRTEGIVADPFLGSGTTMVAAENLNRKCYGIEIDPNYCAVILQRMSDAFPNIDISRIEN